MVKHTFFVTVPKGMEPFLQEELIELKIPDIKKERGGLSFHGTLRDAYRVCLWSRLASRVLLPLKTFSAPNPEKLYGGVRSIKWSDHLTYRHTLAVDFTTSHSQITHTHFGALKTKDAIVDQLKSVQGERPSVARQQPDIRVNVHVNNDIAQVSLDLSGESLHRRGYREEGAAAPLKENLAAALLRAMKWQEITAQGGDFVDFMCGSGTLIIEAAMISSKMAPGTFRKYYGFLKWLGHDAQTWNELQQEMQDVRIRNVESIQSKFIANDIHRMTARSARMNMEKAGVGRMISLHTQSYEEIVAPSEFGLVLVNPPYGERLTERKSVWGGRKEESRVSPSPEESENNLAEMKVFYKKIGDHFKQHYKGWKAGVFVEEGELSRSVGLKPTQRFPFFNGAIDCRLLSYDLY